MLQTDSIRQIYYSDRRDNERSGKFGHPIPVPSFSDDTFSLIISLLLVPSLLDNSFYHIFPLYSKIVNTSQKLCNFERSKIEDNYFQKKRKLNINSNVMKKE